MLAVKSRSRVNLAAMTRLLAPILALLALAVPMAASADPADVDAAARGVVRVVIIGTDGREIYPVSHGSGFAVTSDSIITNAHVVREALLDDTLTIAVVPSEGDEAEYAKAVSVDPRTDLALLKINGPLRLPRLTIAGTVDPNSGEVSSVGYPMNVDRAQGLEIGDIFKSQPPVKSRGFISGTRPARQFDSILHTAPIARGNSGGPLLDGCGRVIGVNSFGADSEGGDAEFYFAVSTRELLPFLRKNDIEPRVNSLPCRSMAELDAEERDRMEREQSDARRALMERTNTLSRQRERAQLEAELSVMTERENAMALAALLIVLSLGSGFIAWQARTSGEERRMMIAGTVSGLALLGALSFWFTRPGLADIDQRVAALMQGTDADDPADPAAADDGTMICRLVESRSRVTSAMTDDLEFGWAEGGCVNERTQYGLSGGDWMRVLVPDDEDTVSVNRYDPASRTFRTDRYLLSRSAMAAARAERSKYTPPKCGAENAAARLGDMQSAVIAMLPNSPNERLVYSCDVRVTDPAVKALAAPPEE